MVTINKKKSLEGKAYSLNMDYRRPTMWFEWLEFREVGFACMPNQVFSSFLLSNKMFIFILGKKCSFFMSIYHIIFFKFLNNSRLQFYVLGLFCSLTHYYFFFLRRQTINHKYKLYITFFKFLSNSRLRFYVLDLFCFLTHYCFFKTTNY